jgi:arylsulfatase A-like enzyme
VYAADNGLAIGSHGLLGKQNLYEHSMKVPVIIAGPAVPKGKISEAMVYLYDLFPTLCSICNLPAPAGVDGKNLFPFIKGETSDERKSLYTAYRNTARAVRTKEWKMIRYPQQNYTQLFNLKNDPLEINNLAYLPKYQSKLEEMTALMTEEYKASGDTINMNPAQILPMDYDYKKLKQKPDEWQPEYILNKYFKDN